jgi:hypothetical protein
MSFALLHEGCEAFDRRHTRGQKICDKRRKTATERE